MITQQLALPKQLAPFLRILALIVAILPCTAQSTDQDRWTMETGNKLFTVTIEPKSGAVEINALQNWIATVLDKDGKPVTPARLMIDGGMKAHGHGLPTAPQVTQYEGDGRYLIEGVRLNMVGQWTIVIGVEYGNQRDMAQFELEIDY